MTETRTKLIIMYCPYCGSPDVHVINRVDGPSEEFVVACCLSCDETFSVDRKPKDEESEDD